MDWTHAKTGKHAVAVGIFAHCFTLQEQFIIKFIYFEGMKQKEVAEILGVTKGALSQRLGTILRKMRTMYLEG